MKHIIEWRRKGHDTASRFLTDDHRAAAEKVVEVMQDPRTEPESIKVYEDGQQVM